MWTLQAMRDPNVADPLGGIGPRVERKPEAAPAAHEPVGVYTGPDGKMRTNLPLPPGPATPPIWPFPTHPPLDTTTEEPGALKVGDRVRRHDGNGGKLRTVGSIGLNFAGVPSLFDETGVYICRVKDEGPADSGTWERVA